MEKSAKETWQFEIIEGHEGYAQSGRQGHGLLQDGRDRDRIEPDKNEVGADSVGPWGGASSARLRFSSHFPQLPPLTLVRRVWRRHGRVKQAFLPPRLDFFGRRRRRQILIQSAGFGLRDVPVGERQDFQALFSTERPADLPTCHRHVTAGSVSPAAR